MNTSAAEKLTQVVKLLSEGNVAYEDRRFERAYSFYLPALELLVELYKSKLVGSISTVR